MKTIAAIVVILAVAGASFWGGIYFEQQRRIAQRQAIMNGTADPSDMPQGKIPGMGGGMGRTGNDQQSQDGQGAQRRTPTMTGRLDKITDDELTLTTNFGSVKIEIGDDTEYKSTEKADFEDLKVKKDIIIEAEPDDDGNMVAKTVVF